MRLLHTADWHLGRTFHGASLLEDQAFALDRLVELADDERVDAVLVSGDVYDRSLPPADAVTLLDETLTRLAEVCGALVVIAGNHDGPERLAFGSRMLAGAGLHVAGPLGSEPVSVALADAHGHVRVWALPYADPPQVAHALGDDGIRGHEAAMAALAGAARSRFAPGERNVVLAHAYVTGGAASESERPLSVGGAGDVSAALFDGFDYVALGHLHRPQQVGSPRVRYSGSLLKYSFDEASHAKSVSVAEIAADGAVTVEERTLPLLRDTRRIRGELDALIAGAPAEGRDDWILAELTDPEPRYNALERLRAVHPNVLGVVRVARTTPEGEAAGPTIEQVKRMGTGELFAGFFREVTGADLTDPQSEIFAELAEGFECARRGEPR